MVNTHRADSIFKRYSGCVFWWCNHDEWAFYQFTCPWVAVCLRQTLNPSSSVKKKHLDPIESHLCQIGRRWWVIWQSSTLLTDVSTQPLGSAEGDGPEKLRNLWEDILLPERQQATSTPSSGLSSPGAADKHRTSCLPSHKTPWEVNTHLSQKQTHPRKGLYT